MSNNEKKYNARDMQKSESYNSEINFLESFDERLTSIETKLNSIENSFNTMKDDLIKTIEDTIKNQFAKTATFFEQTIQKKMVQPPSSILISSDPIAGEDGNEIVIDLEAVKKSIEDIDELKLFEEKLKSRDVMLLYVSTFFLLSLLSKHI